MKYNVIHVKVKVEEIKVIIGIIGNNLIIVFLNACKV